MFLNTHESHTYIPKQNGNERDNDEKLIRYTVILTGITTDFHLGTVNV